MKPFIFKKCVKYISSTSFKYNNVVEGMLLLNHRLPTDIRIEKLHACYEESLLALFHCRHRFNGVIR